MSGSHVVPFIAAFESTYLPHYDLDVAELTDHDRYWREDLSAVAAAGVRSARFPLRWHRIEAEPGVFDWTATDAQLGALRELGIEPIIDIVHHTSYPAWIHDGFRDPRFGPAFVRFAKEVADRYDWIGNYTLFNEPFATLFLAGHEALWPPYDRGMRGLARLAVNVLPAISEAASYYRARLPHARHIWIDTCESHSGTTGGPARHAEMANDRRHALLDLALGRDLDPRRPFLGDFLDAGAAALVDMEPLTIDVLGLDYYSHSEWWYDEHGATSPSPHPVGLAELARHYASRYDVPVILSETNIRGVPSDRAAWLKYTLEQCESALANGVDIRGYCWFPYVDSCDWDSLLARAGGRSDPVGVVGRGARGGRARSVFTDVWESAAAGMPARELPAYTFSAPCDEQLVGFLPGLEHWQWQRPAVDEGAGEAA